MSEINTVCKGSCDYIVSSGDKTAKGGAWEFYVTEMEVVFILIVFL